MLFISHFSLIIDKATRKLGYLSMASVSILVFVVLFNALFRYFLKSGFTSMQELEWHLFAISFLFAIPFTLKHDKHVRLDFIYEHYSFKTKKIFNLFVNLFFIIPFACFIVYDSSAFSYMSFIQNEGSPNGGLAYRFIIKSAITISFLMLIIQSISEILKIILALKSHSQSKKIDSTNEIK